MPRIVRSEDYLMVPDAADLERKKKEEIKMAVERARELKKIKKRERKLKKIRKRK